MTTTAFSPEFDSLGGSVRQAMADVAATESRLAHLGVVGAQVVHVEWHDDELCVVLDNGVCCAFQSRIGRVAVSAWKGERASTRCGKLSEVVQVGTGKLAYEWNRRELPERMLGKRVSGVQESANMSFLCVNGMPTIMFMNYQVFDPEGIGEVLKWSLAD